MAEIGDAELGGAEGQLLFRRPRLGLAIDEGEGAGNYPFADLGGSVEHMGVRLIKLDGFGEFHGS